MCLQQTNGDTHHCFRFRRHRVHRCLVCKYEWLAGTGRELLTGRQWKRWRELHLGY